MGDVRLNYSTPCAPDKPGIVRVGEVWSGAEAVGRMGC